VTSSHPRLVALATATPSNAVTQTAVKRFAEEMFAPTIGADSRLLDVFDNACIDERRLCVPLDWLASDHGLAEKNARYLEHALDLAESVARDVLAQLGMQPRELDHVVFVSSTGIATHSIDARLANRLGLRRDVHRTPIWGLGCAGGAAGLSRSADFARAHPSARVLLIALELCSLTFQRSDLSKKNLVATAIFGDGAAGALIAGPAAAFPNPPRTPIELIASRSTLWPGTLDVMGWEVEDDGLHVVFSRDIPSIVSTLVRPELDAFLADYQLTLDRVDHLVTHPGGARVLSAYVTALEIDPERVLHARSVLRRFGNMSSPSCLFVLQDFLRAGDIHPGDHAVITALGPGFSAEYVLARGGAS
jgi:alkylresorcinol/alkylpyrone synthase